MAERNVMSIFLSEKPELKLALMDEIMYNNKRFQTRKDFDIEVAARSGRHQAYLAAGATMVGSYVLTAPTGQVRRMFGPPDSVLFPAWRMAKDAICGTVLSLNGVRPQLQGFARQMAVFGLPFAVFATMNHWVESQRYSAYLGLKGQTAFGDLADAIDNGDLNRRIEGTLDQTSTDILRVDGNKMALKYM